MTNNNAPDINKAADYTANKQADNGNDPEYSVAMTKALLPNKLTGKTIIFLGSSVTYGAGSEGESFVDFLSKRDGVIAVKEAVSGTTLVDEDVNGLKSYIFRMKTIDTAVKADVFVCQLSTNDAWHQKPLGKVTGEDAGYDVHTVAGAIEYIIDYAQKTWNCPVIFYTSPRFESEAYAAMVELLYQIRDKWKIGIIDFWNDPKVPSPEEMKLYMSDPVHPARAGYREWWTPIFEEYLKTIVGND